MVNTEKMAKSTEDVLLVVPNVKNKKCDGMLYMMSERMAWMPSTKETFTVSHHYADIKIQKISPDSKEKVQLQVVLRQGGASTFHFASPAGRTQQVQDRDNVKELLQQLLPRFRLKVDLELEEKNRMLQEDPLLFQLYKDLVVANVISAEEFWANRFVTKSQTESCKQEVGVSAAFLADIKPKIDGCNGLRYDITPDVVDSVFRTYPAVRQKHYENVPDKMTEEEFWKRFFQSHYFHRDRINFTSKDIFADCAKLDEQAIQEEMAKAPKDSVIDLAAMTDNLLDEGFQVELGDVHSGSDPANASLIKRFNQHSTMVLKSCNRQSSNSVDSTVNQQAADVTVNGNSSVSVTSCTSKLAKIKERVDYNDLQSQIENSSAPALKLARLDPYMHGPTPVVAMQYSTSEDMIHACQAFTQEMMAWQSQLMQVLPTTAAVNVLLELSPGGVLLQSCSQQQLQQTMPSEMQQEMRNLYSAICELLRDFWACFPATSKALEDKVIKMHNHLTVFNKNQLVPFTGKWTAASSQHYSINLVGHMKSMLAAADAKYASWNSKRSQLLKKT